MEEDKYWRLCTLSLVPRFRKSKAGFSRAELFLVSVLLCVCVSARLLIVFKGRDRGLCGDAPRLWASLSLSGSRPSLTFLPSCIFPVASAFLSTLNSIILSFISSRLPTLVSQDIFGLSAKDSGASTAKSFKGLWLLGLESVLDMTFLSTSDIYCFSSVYGNSFTDRD